MSDSKLHHKRNLATCIWQKLKVWMDYGNVSEARCMMGIVMSVTRLVGKKTRQIMEIWWSGFQISCEAQRLRESYLPEINFVWRSVSLTSALLFFPSVWGFLFLSSLCLSELQPLWFTFRMKWKDKRWIVTTSSSTEADIQPEWLRSSVPARHFN